jgi:oligopeptide transport system substrate-binding protein
METYGGSSKIEYTPQDYTTKLTLNTDFNKLKARGREEGVNKTVLTVPEFRKGISLAVNRDEFASAYTAAGSAGYGLLNTMYVFNPSTGEAYRSTSDGRHALCKLYGIEYGNGKKYASLDEAYEAITGYNVLLARAEMQKAYDYATTHDEKGNRVSSGAIYNGKTPVRIDMVVYNADEIYVQMFNYLNKSVKAACKGTGFEGKVSLSMKTDQDYYNSAYAGNVDMMFSTWGGAAYNGLGILSNVYCDDPNGMGNQMEYGFDTSKIELEMVLDEKGDMQYESYRASLKDWADWLNNHAVEIRSSDGGKRLANASDCSVALKTKIFSEAESAYLSHFTAIPLYYRNTAVLKSEKITSAAAAYVDIVGFGGVRFLSYAYDDKAWATANKEKFDYTR